MAGSSNDKQNLLIDVMVKMADNKPMTIQDVLVYLFYVRELPADESKAMLEKFFKKYGIR